MAARLHAGSHPQPGPGPEVTGPRGRGGRAWSRSAGSPRRPQSGVKTLGGRGTEPHCDKRAGQSVGTGANVLRRQAVFPALVLLSSIPVAGPATQENTAPPDHLVGPVTGQRPTVTAGEPLPRAVSLRMPGPDPQVAINPAARLVLPRSLTGNRARADRLALGPKDPAHRSGPCARGKHPEWHEEVGRQLTSGRPGAVHRLRTLATGLFRARDRAVRGPSSTNRAALSPPPTRSGTARA